MMKLIAVCCLVVVSFVLCVESFKISNDLDSLLDMYQQAGMFKNNGEKQVHYLETVYPSSQIKSIGQVGGLDTMPDGNLVVFHRADRYWTYDSFNGNNFNKKRYGPIEQDTITLINTNKMEKLDSWGSGLFYMPHGLTIDHEGKAWLTDVGLHQVFKFDMNNMETPELVLGEAFVFGEDENHFCKPTDVAVAKSNGHVFVSDGYCNKRVVEFDKSGKFVKTFEDKDEPMFVVHSITIVEPLNMVCTVSREQGRIVCFDIESGKKMHQIEHADMKTVYAIKYDASNEVLHAATGDNHRQKEAAGLTFDASEANFGKFLQLWTADDRDLTRVHDLTTTRDGSRVYLGQLNGEIDEMSFE